MTAALVLEICTFIFGVSIGVLITIGILGPRWKAAVDVWQDASRGWERASNGWHNIAESQRDVIKQMKDG